MENVMLKAVREQREGLKLEHHSELNLSMDLSIAELRSEPIDRASVAEEKPQTNTVDPSSENSTDPEVNQ